MESRIIVRRTARTFTLGAISTATREVWIVLHGYAQLAEHFIRWFRSLDDGSRVIVAPEALSRFYVAGTNGHVGASWMTKADRLAEIDDYIEYLDAVAAATLSGVDRSRVQLVILGFSQGAATAARWAVRGAEIADRLVLWGGGLPSDVAIDPVRFADVQLVIGTRDEYRDDEVIERDLGRLKDGGGDVRFVEFDGTHRVEAESLGRVAAAIRERGARRGQKKGSSPSVLSSSPPQSMGEGGTG